MQRNSSRKWIILVITTVLVGLMAWPLYYYVRYPYHLQHAEQTSLSRHWWEPLMIVMQGQTDDVIEQLMAIDCRASAGEWADVQRLTNRMMAEGKGNQEFLTYYHNLSLAQQGLLADSLMHHYAPFERALFLPVDEQGNYLVFMAASEAWYAVGDMTMAEHATMLGMLFSPRHTGTRALRRLAQINIAQGDSAAAAKYLRILSSCPKHRQWAHDMSLRLSGLTLRDGHDILRLSHQYQQSLRNVIDNDPANTLAREYLLCLDLLLKDLVSFRADWQHYGPCHNPSGQVSRLYQEAILILMANDAELRDSWHDYVQADTYYDFTHFNQLFGQAGNSDLSRLAPYRYTYWYYFKYAHRNENN